MAKSLEKYPDIKEGVYVGLWSAYYVEILFSDGSRSDKIKLDIGVKGMNLRCRITVDKKGILNVE